MKIKSGRNGTPFLVILLLSAACLLAAGCDDSLMGGSSAGGSSTEQGNTSMTTGVTDCGDPKPIPGWPKSGYYLEFKASHEVFHVWLTSAEGTAALEAWLELLNPLPEALGYPAGDIELDHEYNTGYSYRLKPGEVTFGTDFDESCDAAPCYVEQNPASWLLDPTRWCPWSAFVQKVWDCAAGDGTSCAQVYPAQ